MPVNKRIFSRTKLSDLLSEEHSAVILQNSTTHVLLHPTYLNNIQDGLWAGLFNKLKTYDSRLEGIIIGYDKLQCCLDQGEFYGRNAEILYPVKCDVYLFQPIVGSKLYGVVNVISPDHIGCLVHTYFNATIKRPENEDYDDWKNRPFNFGDTILFVVKDLDYTGHIPYIEGELVPEDTKPKKKTVANKKTSKPGQSSENGHEDEKSEKKSKKKRKNIMLDFISSTQLGTNSPSQHSDIGLDFEFLSPIPRVKTIENKSPEDLLSQIVSQPDDFWTSNKARATAILKNIKGKKKKEILPAIDEINSFVESSAVSKSVSPKKKKSQVEQITDIETAVDCKKVDIAPHNDLDNSLEDSEAEVTNTVKKKKKKKGKSQDDDFNKPKTNDSKGEIETEDAPTSPKKMEAKENKINKKGKKLKEVTKLRENADAVLANESELNDETADLISSKKKVSDGIHKTSEKPIPDWLGGLKSLIAENGTNTSSMDAIIRSAKINVSPAKDMAGDRKNNESLERLKKRKLEFEEFNQLTEISQKKKSKTSNTAVILPETEEGAHVEKRTHLDSIIESVASGRAGLTNEDVAGDIDTPVSMRSVPSNEKQTKSQLASLKKKSTHEPAKISHLIPVNGSVATGSREENEVTPNKNKINSKSEPFPTGSVSSVKAKLKKKPTKTIANADTGGTIKESPSKKSLTDSKFEPLANSVSSVKEKTKKKASKALATSDIGSTITELPSKKSHIDSIIENVVANSNNSDSDSTKLADSSNTSKKMSSKALATADTGCTNEESSSKKSHIDSIIENVVASSNNSNLTELADSKTNTTKKKASKALATSDIGCTNEESSSKKSHIDSIIENVVASSNSSNLPESADSKTNTTKKKTSKALASADTGCTNEESSSKKSHIDSIIENVVASSNSSNLTELADSKTNTTKKKASKALATTDIGCTNEESSSKKSHIDSIIENVVASSNNSNLTESADSKTNTTKKKASKALASADTGCTNEESSSKKSHIDSIIENVVASSNNSISNLTDSADSKTSTTKKKTEKKRVTFNSLTSNSDDQMKNVSSGAMKSNKAKLPRKKSTKDDISATKNSEKPPNGVITPKSNRKKSTKDPAQQAIFYMKKLQDVLKSEGSSTLLQNMLASLTKGDV